MSEENLPSVLKDGSQKEIMLMTGQSTGYEANPTNTLRVNYDDEDSDNRSIPRGQWTMFVDGKQVFAEEVSLRIMLTRMQYSHFDQDKNEHVSSSIYFTSYSDECPDTAGTFRCGKPTKKELQKLPEDEQAAFKAIKLSKVIFGFVSCEAKTADGEDVSVKDHPVLFYARGTHFMPMAEYLEGLTSQGILMMGVNTKLKLNKKKNGAVVYWEVDPEVADTVEINLEKDTATLQELMTWINAENDAILEKWQEIRAKGDGTIDTTAKVINLENDFDDDLPADMK